MEPRSSRGLSSSQSPSFPPAERVDAYNSNTKVSTDPSAIYHAMIWPLTLCIAWCDLVSGESNGAEGRSYYHKKHAI